jgi:hypothetical protein
MIAKQPIKKSSAELSGIRMRKFGALTPSVQLPARAIH